MILKGNVQFNRLFDALCDRSYAIKYVRPTLERDTLEDRQHGKAKVVEIRDTPVWTLPKLFATIVVGPNVVALKAAISARNWLFHYRVYKDNSNANALIGNKSSSHSTNFEQ